MERTFLSKLTPSDWMNYLYFGALSLLTLLLHRRVPSAGWLIAGHLGFLLLLTLLIGVTREDSPRLLVLLRTFLPLIFIFFTYRETELYMRIFRDRWLDAEVVSLERWVFGVQPVLWLERVVRPWLTEYAKLVYGIYFLLIPLLPLALFLTRRDGELREYLFTLLLSFYLCYVGFMLFPVQGPRYWYGAPLPAGREFPFPLVLNPEGLRFTLPRLQGWFFTGLVDRIMAGGDSTGACIPSAHNAAAVTILIGVRRYYPKLFAPALALVACICLATVYNRYHYVTDMVSGIATGLFAAFLGRRLHRRWLARPRPRAWCTGGRRPDRLGKLPFSTGSALKRRRLPSTLPPEVTMAAIEAERGG